MEVRSNSKFKIRFILIMFFLIILTPFLSIFMQYKISFDFSFIQNFNTIFISIILEAIPFILLGAFISALIQEFVSEQLIAKIIPKNKFLGLLGAAFLGIIFPVCECAIIPITKRLIKKGVPTGIAVTFMLSVPIVNPIVLLSTYYAFYDRPSMVLIRGGFGLLVAVIVGFLVTCVEIGNSMPIKDDRFDLDDKCYCGCDSYNDLYNKHSKVKSLLEHTSKEFMNIIKYLIFGAALSSIFQTLVPKQSIAFLGHNQVLSVIILMLLAFVLSVCSEADAFIARTFLGQFTIGAVGAFLILGPMLDIKNTLMLFGNFKRGLVIRLIIYIALITISVSCLVNTLAMRGVIR